MNLKSLIVAGCLAWLIATTPSAFAQGSGPTNVAASRLLFNSWKLPIAPRKLIGNIYYVGAAGVSSYLITTSDGDILIDTTFEDVVPQIQKNIEQLGFHMHDIKFILSSHAHADHTGGHALMKQLTGAQIVASAPDAHVLETGGEDDFSPYPKELMRYTPVKADRIVVDGERVTLGDATFTAHLTPGHTKGATTWTLPFTDAGEHHTAVFFSSTSIVQGTKLVNNPDYPAIADDFETTFSRLKQLDCDVFFAPHGGQFAMSAKFAKLDQAAKPNPFIDPEGWKKTVADAENAYQRQLTAERLAAKP